MPRGLIIKALSGFYYVEDNESKQIYACRGRGLFRKENISPLVGDKVTYNIEANMEGLVTDIEPRKNELVRPQIANVDQVLLVFSVKKPDFNQPLLDRFLSVIECSNIQPILIFSKIDLLYTESEIKQFVDFYEAMGYEIILTSKYDELTIKKVCEVMKDKISVLAGQSGVGKSTLLNAINPLFKLTTAEISNALGRGKHTTRHVELFPVCNGLVADTPGFSSLDFQELEISVDMLKDSFKDYQKLSANCKFRGCTHINEPKCAVKEKLNVNSVYDARYQNYKNFYDEIKNQRIIYQKKQ